MPMMHQTNEFQVLQTDVFQAVQLPYGNGRISMVIVLPRMGQSLDAVASSLTEDQWKTWMSSMTSHSVDLTMPRFHVDYSASLVRGLQYMGIRDAFDGGKADFSPMSATSMYVSDVLHKTTLDVDEAGTVATAATAITMVATAAEPMPAPPPIVIRVDHPFLCAIEDSKTGVLLFVGFIRDPGVVQAHT
jgi:serine protease inhibitor